MSAKQAMKETCSALPNMVIYVYRRISVMYRWQILRASLPYMGIVTISNRLQTCSVLLQQLYGEIVQLQSALNDEYNNVQEKSNMYHISEPIIIRFFPKLVLLCSLSSSFHWFIQLRNETLQHFARFWRLFRSVMWSSLVPLKFLFSFFSFFLDFFNGG